MNSATGDTNSRDSITQLSRKRTVEELESDSSEDEKIYDLTIGKFPKDWNFPRVQEFVQEICGPVDMIEMLRDKDLKFNGKICLTFDSSEKCMKAAQSIRNKEVGGKRLTAVFDGIDKPLESEVTGIGPKKQKIKEEPNCSPNTDQSDSYNLSPVFLKRLDIALPIDKWVVVSNFSCDKSELRDLMELAGHVVWCVVYQPDRYARVLYNHPLEAVQAVSMLDGQTYFGKTLKVVLEKQPSDTVILPKGLANIGPGLGKYGLPIRDISSQYTKFIKGQDSDLNLNFFESNPSGIEPYGPNNIRPFKVVNVTELKENRKSSPVLNSKDENKAGTITAQKETVVSKSSVPDNRMSMVPTFLQASIGLSSAPLPPGVSRFEMANQNSNQQNGGRQNSVGPSPNTMSRGPSPMPPAQMGPRPMGPGPMGPGPMGPGPMGPGPMGPRPMGPGQMGPRPMGPGQMGPSPIGPRPLSTGPLGPGPMGPGPMGPGPMRPGPMGPRAMGPTQMGPPAPRFGPGPMAGPRPPPGPMFGPRPGPMGGPMGPRPNIPHGNDPATVQFSNLPPSTTFPCLSDRLAKVGQVMSLNFTTPGCAVVRFAHPAQADQCIHLVFYRGSIDECRAQSALKRQSTNNQPYGFGIKFRLPETR